MRLRKAAVLGHCSAAYRRPYAVPCIKDALVSDECAGTVAAGGIMATSTGAIGLDDWIYMGTERLRGGAIRRR